MTPARYSQIREIFQEAAELDSSVRADYLDRVCADDQELRWKVDQLLDKHDQEGLFLDRPVITERALIEDRAFAAGTLVSGRFRIERFLGEGGMGQVFEATDTELHMRVALKTLRLNLADSADYAERFRREIQLARQVTHPNVCRVYDAGRHGATQYFTMELLEGETLSHRLHGSGKLTPQETLPIVEQMCAGLAASHAVGVLHRDLKPANVMLAGGRAVLMDFGLARLRLAGLEQSISSGLAIGTPAYMSPEQIEGKPLTPAADIYALGVVLYEMLTGRRPHEASSPLAMAAKKVKDPPPPLGSIDGIPASWEPAILKCLAYEPENRFRSAQDLAGALASPSTARMRDRASRRAFSKRTVPIAAAIVILLAGGWWLSQRISSPPLPAEVARWYDEGVTALSDGANNKAARLLETTVQAEPSFAAAHARLAEAYQELDMRDRAQDEVLKAISLKPRTSEERLLVQGVQFAMTGDWDAALGSARKRESSGGRMTAILDRGRWLERAGKAPEAIAAYEEVLKEDRSQPGALLRFAMLRTQQGRNPEASAWLDRAEESYRTLSNVEGLGFVALARSTIAPTVNEAIRLEQDAEQKARDVSSDLLLVRAQRARAASIQRLGQTDEARTLALSAIATAEKAGLLAEAVNGRIELGSVPFQMGKYEAAEKDFEEAVAMAKRFRTLKAGARANVTMGQLYSNTNRPELAVPLEEDGIRYYKSVGDLSRASQALRFLASARQLLGKESDARASFEEAYRLSPSREDRVRASQGLAGLADREGRLGEAVRQFKSVVADYESMGNHLSAQTFRLQLARVLTNVGRFEESQAELDRIAKEKPVNALIAFDLEMTTASLEYQEMKTTQALRRIEGLRARALQAGELDHDREARLQLCAKYAVAGDAPHAEPLLQEARDGARRAEDQSRRGQVGVGDDRNEGRQSTARGCLCARSGLDCGTDEATGRCGLEHARARAGAASESRSRVDR